MNFFQNQADAQKKLLTVTHEKQTLDAAMNALKIQSDGRIRELESQVAQLMESLEREKSNAEIVNKSFEAKIAKKEKMIAQYKTQEEQILVIQGKYEIPKPNIFDYDPHLRASYALETVSYVFVISS